MHNHRGVCVCLALLRGRQFPRRRILASAVLSVRRRTDRCLRGTYRRGVGLSLVQLYPAKVFMGDTGSLAIGGMLGVVAICCKQELLLVVVGGVFVIEAVSVIMQVLSFKLTG